MNFIKWWENKGFFIFKKDPEDSLELSRASWDACKEKVLEILKKDIQNLDLSFESCDKRYIEKIEQL